ncbi:hypothetical protein VTN77DRAFT_5386 [Rasamsonia byssochlamydoides]|uniref:uncharacterized protein n=1 Tax=Rasamsonia byssochlamydoides TaxID=89139 RepID=UPI003743F1C8
MALQVWSFLPESSTLGAVPKGSLTTAVLLAIFFVFLVTYTVTSILGAMKMRSTPGRRRSPPTLPYAIPFLRHLPESLINERGFMERAMTWYGTYTPVRVHVGNYSYSILSGPKAISTLFKNSKRLITNKWLVGIMITAFGLPPADAHLYLKDDTGYGAQPLEGAKMTNPDHRIFYLGHRRLYASLAGPGLEAMARQLILSLAEQISQCGFDFDRWTDVSDLYAGLIRKMTFKASITSLCGSHIFTVNPDLDDDFWKFDAAMVTLLQWPEWMIPGARRAREKMKQNMTRWHRFAEQHYDVSKAAEDPRDWEEYFGNKIMRMRNQTYHKLPLSDEAYAAEDVGLLWAANSNAVPAVIWFVIEIVQRPELLARVREEIAPCIKHDGINILDVDVARLCNNPLLQSIYAEILRLQVGIILPWVTSGAELDIDGWSVKEGETLVISTWHAGRDSRVWNTSSADDPHPVDEFWAERFLVKPGDAVHTGPIKKVDKAAAEETVSSCPYKPAPSQSDKDCSKGKESNQCTFSMAGTAGSWIPYGGGIKLCPGRHFAKQEIIIASAMYLAAFDIELIVDQKKPKQKQRIVADDRFFMFGVLHPKGEIRARIRRRRLS